MAKGDRPSRPVEDREGRVMAMAEVQAEIAATKAALAGLRAAVMAHLPAQTAPLQHDAVWIITLDRLYSAATGTELSLKNGPAYTGKVLAWPWDRDSARRKAINAIVRLRRGQQSRITKNTAATALNYFSQHWPADLEWPRNIARPASTTSKGRAA